MKKLCSIATALIMALTVFIVPNFGLAYATEPDAVNDDQAITEDISAAEEMTEYTEATENPAAIVEEPASEPEVKAAVLAAPTLSVSSSSEAITFSWDAVEGAEGYKVSEDGDNWNDISNDTSYSLEGTGVTLYLKAYAGSDESEVSELSLSAPTQITELKGTPSYTNIKYTWTEVDGASGYAIRRGTDSLVDNNYRENETLSFNRTGLKQRTSYSFCVRTFVEVPEGTEGGVWINPPGTKVENFKFVLFGPVAKVVVKTLTKERVVRTKYSKGYKYKYYDQNGVYRGTSYAMWNTIKNKKSKTKYLIALDTRRNNVVIYKGKKGNWKVYKHFVCACGMEGHRTPRGDFKIKSKKPKFQTGDKVGKKVVRAKYTCWYATRIKGAIFFHSTLYHLNSKSRHAARHVGKHYSHGCIRLEIKNAKWIYNNCKKGTAVISRKYGKDNSYGYQFTYKY